MMAEQSEGIRVIDLALDRQRELNYLMRHPDLISLSAGILRIKLHGSD
jgi:hypothetical protein